MLSCRSRDSSSTALRYTRMGAGDRRTTALRRLEEKLSRAAGTDVRLERPGKPEHGDYATNVALQLAGARRRPPMEIAAELRDVAGALPGVEDAAVAPPGFLNLRMSSAWFGEALAEIGDDYGAGSAETRERVQVELVSANPTGPLTVGSGRNGAYGDSVARLLEFAGHEVSREHYVNDAGGQADLFRASVAARARGEDPPEGGYLGAYVQELADRGGDPVELMLARIRETLERFRVHVDVWVRESELESEIREALAGLDGHIYVLGSDHHGYVVRLKALAAASGHELDSVEVLLYQLVHLTEGGEARKVSKRRGDVVLLEELMDEIGVDAARWYLVRSGHEQTIDIDVDLARERSEKNPVYYVQYAHARIAGILRNVGDAVASADPPAELAQEERELVKRLLEFPALVAEATERRGPHALTTYAIRVADDFHRFYHRHRVLESDAQAFRLALCRATRSVIARSLDLVGVAAPERM